LHEPELIAGLKQGREEAFERLILLFRDRIYNTSLSFIQNREDAEEITQDVFISVYERIHTFRNDASLGTWLYRIAVTRSLELIRKQNRKKRKVLNRFFGGQGAMEEQPDFYHPGVATERKEDAAILFKAIRQLPAQQQTAFLLRKTENLSQQEIASVMKTSASAVESLLQRARSNLKKILESYYKHYDE
jgi:RNA polymerase sigma factor (sigma-70 family)